MKTMAREVDQLVGSFIAVDTEEDGFCSSTDYQFYCFRNGFGAKLGWINVEVILAQKLSPIWLKFC